MFNDIWGVVFLCAVVAEMWLCLPGVKVARIVGAVVGAALYVECKCIIMI